MSLPPVTASPPTKVASPPVSPSATRRAELVLIHAVKFPNRTHCDCSPTGALQKAHQWGHKWLEARELFGEALYHGIVSTIHSLATALFHTIWAMTAGQFFTEKKPREIAGQCWVDAGKSLLITVKSASGVLCPTVARWLHENFFPAKPQTAASSTPPPPKD